MTNKDTLMEEIQRVEDKLKDTLRHLDIIEEKLNSKLLTIEKREKLEKELDDVKHILKCNEQRLLNLRKENSKSFMVAACMVFACFLFYGIYLMFFNQFKKL